MCLAVPMELVQIDDDGQFGQVELEGVSYKVNLTLIDEPVTGDYLLVHAGTAIEKLDLEEAEERLRLFAEIARISAGSLSENSIESEILGLQV
jgi:hydrogenase expression/formation protein HypC